MTYEKRIGFENYAALGSIPGSTNDSLSNQGKITQLL